MTRSHTPRKALLLAWGVLGAVVLLTALVLVPAAISVPFDFTVNKLFVQDGKDQEILALDEAVARIKEEAVGPLA